MTKQERFAAAVPALLSWYRAGARDLPWRHTRDPYCIWVSEIMLQQTRVAAVLDYYARFLAAFPDVYALAAAPEEQLLSLWQGLGYYSRARNLHRAAKIVAARGGFPDTFEELRTLPGVGEYTAGAVASAAFGRPVPAVDGNVLRVTARLLDCHEDVRSPAVKTAVRDVAAAAFPEREEDIRIYNQSLMELGAVVCVPNGPPSCESCPAAALCLARERGTVSELPVRGTKKPRRVEERTVFVLLRDGRTALRKRPETGLLAGLWEFPNVPGTLDEPHAAAYLAEQGITVKSWEQRISAKHIFTHMEWHMTGYVLTVTDTKTVVPAPGSQSDSAAPGLDWVDVEELRQRAVPSAFARFREAAAERLTEGGGGREV